MPFVAVAIVVIVGTMGISIDLLQDVQAAQQLEFAAQQAALYGESFAFQPDTTGVNNTQLSQNAVASNVVSGNFNGINTAFSGPKNSLSPVSLEGADVTFFQNPNDKTETFLSVAAGRQGANALKQFFWTAGWTSRINTNTPQNTRTFQPSEVVRALGQPAARIGPGPEPNSTYLSAQAQQQPLMSRPAAFPIGINGQDFIALITQSAATPGALCNLVIVNSGPSSLPLPANSCAAAFTNVASGEANGSYYGSATGANAVQQLEQLVDYFSASPPSTAIAPAAVERGSKLALFNTTDSSFQTQLSQITTKLRSVQPNNYYVVPVLSSLTNPAVAGFALLRLKQFTVQGTQISATFFLADSAPIRNASTAAGFSSIPPGTQTQLPAPTAPFLPRAYDPATDTFAKRLPGIALAPALFPPPPPTAVR